MRLRSISSSGRSRSEFIDAWRPLYQCILGNVGFMDQFTVIVNRFAQATALERRTYFDDRFGTAQ